MVQLWLSLVGTSGVGLVRVRLRVGSDWAVLWCAVVCVWPQLVWFSVGSALVQVCVATWITGAGEVLMWLSFASGGRSIHGVWFSSGGVVWFSYELLLYHMWCVCGSYH